MDLKLTFDEFEDIEEKPEPIVVPMYESTV